MRNNRLLIIAVILIALGLMGSFITTWLGSYWKPRRMFPMPGMMNGGMMGQGMMNRDQMREMMQRMMPGMLPPGIKADDLPDSDSKGARLLTRYCGQCHYLPGPGMHIAQEWPLVASRMFSRMSMMSGMGGMSMMNIESPSLEEQREILEYLKTHSLRPISPEALPSPDSKGAILFKAMCSQCHTSPDPTLHTAAEWQRTVERMQKNMQTMGKKVVTDQEKKEIIAYLSDYARK